MNLSTDIIDFFHSQGCLLICSIDENGFPHSSCKGLVKIDTAGLVYLLDVYQGKTYANITRSPQVSVSAFDEHRFIGYCLKGKAEISARENLSQEIIDAWDNKITSRLTQRLIKNLQQEKGSLWHPEAKLPRPNTCLP